MLQGRGFVVLELSECLVFIPWHGEVDFAIGIVPVQCDANVPGTGPICTAFVVFFDYWFEMERMLLPDVLDPAKQRKRQKSW